MRVQKSVFECVLTQDQLEMLQRKLTRYIKAEEDQIRFYPMSSRTRRKVLILGVQPDREVDDTAFIV